MQVLANRGSAPGVDTLMEVEISPQVQEALEQLSCQGLQHLCLRDTSFDRPHGDFVKKLFSKIGVQELSQIPDDEIEDYAVKFGSRELFESMGVDGIRKCLVAEEIPDEAQKLDIGLATSLGKKLFHGSFANSNAGKIISVAYGVIRRGTKCGKAQYMQ